jgi:hypothetical protein
VLSPKHFSPQKQKMDEETMSTSTTYSQKLWKDYTQFGKIRTKLYKSGYEFHCVFNKNNACTSTQDNTTYNTHMAQSMWLIIRKTIQM